MIKYTKNLANYNPDMKDLSPEDQERLRRMARQLDQDCQHMIGYPSTRIVDFSPLNPFLELFLNNIGDPYTPTAFRLHTHDIEVEVIEWFKEILGGQDSDLWGYVTNGGTEGNMYGVYLARELYPNGIVYYSEDTHYSVAKILRMINARSVMIRSQPNGEIDYDDLDQTLNLHRDMPAIIFANIGTTMRGAVDDLTRIKDILKRRAINRYYIHADAALSGMILPFVDDPQPFGFDAGIDSIAISGHKMPGAPMPCGVVLARQEHTDRVARTVEYIGTADTTVSGSRNGVTPLFLWYEIKALGVEGFRDIIAKCLATADYAIEQFASHDIKAWRHKNSLTVVFPKTNPAALRKWQIATQGEEAHLLTMPHVTEETIDAFISDYTGAPLRQQHPEAAE